MEQSFTINSPIYIDMLPKRDEFYTGVCIKANSEVFLIVTLDDSMGCYDGLTLLKNNEIGNIRPLDEEELAAIEINNWQNLASGIAVGTINTIGEFFQWAKKCNKLVSIFTSGRHEGYYVGKVETVLNDSVVVMLIDEMGKWLQSETLRFSTIDSISFDSFYEREIMEKLDGKAPTAETKKRK